MKIYFAGSIKGGRQDADLYAEMIEYLKTKGNVLTEHIGSENVSHDGQSDYDRTPKFVHDRDIEWLTATDVVIAEVTIPSLGVGYEIGRAFDMGKKILCLYRKEPETLSKMIGGCPGVEVGYYSNLDQAKEQIDNFLQTIK